MNDQTDRQNGPVISTSTARSAWLTILAVGAPALVYLVVAVNQYDGRHYLRGDCQYYFYTAVSLLQDQDIDLANQLPPPPGRHSDDVALDQQGHLVPKHPIWMAIFSIPFIFVFGLNAYLLGSPLTTSYDRMAQIQGNTIVVHSQRSDFDRPIMVLATVPLASLIDWFVNGRTRFSAKSR